MAVTFVEPHRIRLDMQLPAHSFGISAARSASPRGILIDIHSARSPSSRCNRTDIRSARSPSCRGLRSDVHSSRHSLRSSWCGHACIYAGSSVSTGVGSQSTPIGRRTGSPDRATACSHRQSESLSWQSPRVAPSIPVRDDVASGPFLAFESPRLPSPPLRQSGEDTVKVGDRAFNVGRLLGHGAFGNVWEARELGLEGAPPCVLKSTVVQDKRELDAAVLECEVLQMLTMALDPRSDASRHVPRYLAHDTTPSAVRLAMTQVEGLPLDRWLYGASMEKLMSFPAAEALEGVPGSSQVGTATLAEACDIAGTLLFQLAPVLSVLHSVALHRDIASHNLHVSGSVCRLDFALVDFGMAVHIATWRREWRASRQAGDPLYWSPAAWVAFAHGRQCLDRYPELQRLYKDRPDHFSFAVTLLEVVFGLWAGPSQGCGPVAGLVAVARSRWQVYFLRVFRFCQQFHNGNAGFSLLRAHLRESRELALLVADWEDLCAALRDAASEAGPYTGLFLAVAGLMDSQSMVSWEQILELGPQERQPMPNPFC